MGRTGGVRWWGGARGTAGGLGRSGAGEAGAACRSRLQPARWARLTPPARRTMAQFLFEADLHGLLKLDTPIPNAPPARWQRKAKESGPGPSPVGVSPMKPANRSHSFSKTPSKTPGERRPPAAEVECRSLAQAALLVCSHEAPLPSGVLFRQEEVGCAPGNRPPPSSMRGRALSTGAGELLIPQLSLGGTAACWDKCGRDCQLTLYIL